MVDNLGREREMLSEIKAKPGKSLQTTIDLDLQAVAELGTEGKRGALVALNPNNGEILAMVSRPSFDPNKFWRYPDDQRRERAVMDAYEPGSTYKLVTAAAARVCQSASSGMRARADSCDLSASSSPWDALRFRSPRSQRAGRRLRPWRGVRRS